jgi:hypothetical protein
MLRKLSVLLPLPFLAALGLSFAAAGWSVGPAWANGGQRGVALARSAGSDPVRVTMAPVGLSFEYPTMAQILGTGPCPPASVIAQFRSLGSPPLALAGDSQDMTVPSGAITGAPPSWETATLYTLPAAFWSQLHCLLSASKDPLAVGINAKTGELAWATQIVAGAQTAATNGLEFSVGNEPDLYVLPNYSALGTKLSEQEDLAAIHIYLKLAANLQQAVGNLPILGPELAAASHWQRQLPGVISELHEHTVGVHLYPLSACKDPRAVKVSVLLSEAAANVPASLGWVVADADGAGVPAIISESNSVSCGGGAGVANSPASAVWAVRFVLSALRTGFREVRFHFSGAAYDAFVVHGEAISNRPLESALAALNRWLPIGSSLSTGASVHGLRITSVRNDPGGPETILDNESSKPQAVTLHAAHALVGQELSATRAGLQTVTLASRGGRVTVPGNSVIGVLP